MTNNDVLYNVIEAAKLLKIGKNHMYDLINAGLIPVLNLGGYKIRRSTLESFAAKYEGFDLTDCLHIEKISVK